VVLIKPALVSVPLLGSPSRETTLFQDPDWYHACARQRRAVPFASHQQRTARLWAEAALQGGTMQTTSNTEAVRAEPRPTTQDRARKPAPARKPTPSGLSREELKKLVIEMIG
jgi:hypothetical protein